MEVLWFLNGCRSAVTLWGRELWVSGSFIQNFGDYLVNNCNDGVGRIHIK